MRTLIVLVFAALLLPSCVTYRKCQQKFPPSTDTLQIVEVRDSIVLKDTTITVTIPGEVVIDSVFIPVELPPTYKPDTVFARTELAESFAYINRNGLLRLHLTQRDTTITLRLENALKEAYFWRSEYERVKVTPPPVKFVPKIYKITFTIVLVEIGILLLYLFWRMRR